jgi:hypothetical protein
MTWTQHDRDPEYVTYLHLQDIGVNLAEIETVEGVTLGMVNVVPSDVSGIELEANDGQVALRIYGTGYAVEVALPIPAIKFIALIDGAITHASQR